MKNKVIIFDMDGVLIDSEPAYLEMNKKLFTQFGIQMDDENYSALVGMPSLPMWTMLKKKYNLKNEISEFLGLEKQRMSEVLDSDIINEPIKGIVHLLDHLEKEQHKLCVASSSANDNINFVLRKLELKKYFDYVISGEDVINGKPEPDIFLKAAENFKAKVSDCIVIEDSTNGIKAAAAAGMKCIGFKNKDTNMQNLSEADLIVQSFEAEDLETIIKFIKNIFK